MSEPILSLQNTQIFQRENLVLTDVHIQIQKGEFVYLIGKTGSTDPAYTAENSPPTNATAMMP